MTGAESYGQAKQGAGFAEASNLYGQGDTQGALAALMRVDPRSAASLIQAQNNANSVYGTPIYGTTPDGKTAIGTFNKGGQFRQVETGGFTPTPGIRTIDTGTGTLVIDSRTGQPRQGTAPAQQSGLAAQTPAVQNGYVPKDVAGEAREKKYGAEVGDRQADLGRARSAVDTAVSNIDRFSDAVKSIATDPSLGKITGVQGVFPNWPGGRAANVQARLDNVTSQAGFAVLQAMRDASKTGGALGQVSDFENRQLQNNLAALSRAQDEKQYREQLQKIVEWGEGVKRRLSAAYEQDYANIPKPNPSGQPTTQTMPVPQQRPVTKSIGGKNYIQIGKDWYEQ